jgi:predicted molibdopterin-dependent oxidoreductase YjgC
LPEALPGQVPLSDAAAREALGRLWGVQPPSGAGQSYRQMVTGGVRALYVMGDDPAAEPAVAGALRKLDFLVVQDLYLTATAQLADVVLPASSWPEHDGTYTNLERRVQRGPAAIRAVGQSRPDWEILASLAARWQVAEAASPGKTPEAAEPEWKRKRRRGGKAPGPAARPWNLASPAAVMQEIGRAVPFYGEMRWETLGPAGSQWPAGLARPVRRPDLIDVPAVPIAQPGTYWLASGPILWSDGALLQHAHERLRPRAPVPFVALNHSDLALAGLAEGSVVTVSSPAGSVTLTLCADAAVQPGTAWVPGGLAGRPAEALGAGQGEPVAVRIVG